MKSFYQILSIVSVLSLLSACGAKKNDDNGRIEVWGNVAAVQYSKTQNLTCSDPNGCSGAIASILAEAGSSFLSTSFQTCSGFLIAPDIVATNSHCIPDEVKKDPDSCSSKIAIKLYGDQKNIRVCLDLIEASEISAVGASKPDYAFMRIQPVNIRPIAISKSIEAHDKMITATQVTKVGENNYVIKSETCELKFGSFLNGKALNRYSKLLLGFGCKSVPGNSGSPVLNTRGEAVGIVQAMVEQLPNSLLNLLTMDGQPLPVIAPPHAILTNLSCVVDPVTQTSRDAECVAAEKLELLPCYSKYDSSITKHFLNHVIPQAKELPSIFEYKLKAGLGAENSENDTSIKLTHFSFSPVCVKSTHQTSSYSDFVSQKRRFFKRYDVLEASPQLSGAYQYKIEVQNDFTLKGLTSWKVDPPTFPHKIELIRQGGVWKGTVATGNGEQSYSLPTCTDRELEAEDSVTTILESEDEIRAMPDSFGDFTCDK